MNCADAREWFSAYLDEALDAGERNEIEGHLAGCGECRRELERFRQTLALLHRVERPRAPVGFVDRVLAAAAPVPWYGRALRGLFFPLRVKLPL
jgi:anti-sigma factor RsiW